MAASFARTGTGAGQSCVGGRSGRNRFADRTRRKPLFGCIYRMVVLPQDAEDLLQDVVVRVLENIREYRILKEVLGFTNQQAAGILSSERVFRHRLAAAREKMIEGYESLCALINKNGVCHQCRIS